MPILGTLIIIVHIYAGTLKTPETGRKHANKGIYSRTIAEAMLLYYLPIIGSYTEAPEANGSKRKRQTKNRYQRQTPEVYIHSGIIGNAIPGSEKSAETVRS